MPRRHCGLSTAVIAASSRPRPPPPA